MEIYEFSKGLENGTPPVLTENQNKPHRTISVVSNHPLTFAIQPPQHQTPILIPLSVPSASSAFVRVQQHRSNLDSPTTSSLQNFNLNQVSPSRSTDTIISNTVDSIDLNMVYTPSEKEVNYSTPNSIPSSLLQSAENSIQQNVNNSNCSIQQNEAFFNKYIFSQQEKENNNESAVHEPKDYGYMSASQQKFFAELDLDAIERQSKSNQHVTEQNIVNNNGSVETTEKIQEQIEQPQEVLQEEDDNSICLFSLPVEKPEQEIIKIPANGVVGPTLLAKQDLNAKQEKLYKALLDSVAEVFQENQQPSTINDSLQQENIPPVLPAKHTTSKIISPSKPTTVNNNVDNVKKEVLRTIPNNTSTINKQAVTVQQVSRTAITPKWKKQPLQSVSELTPKPLNQKPNTPIVQTKEHSTPNIKKPTAQVKFVNENSLEITSFSQDSNKEDQSSSNSALKKTPLKATHAEEEDTSASVDRAVSPIPSFSRPLSPSVHNSPPKPILNIAPEVKICFDHFGISVFQRGNSYFHDDHIFDLQEEKIADLDDGITLFCIRAKCWGNSLDAYVQEIFVTNLFNLDKSKCTCPVATRCKHCCAAVLKYVDCKKNGKPLRDKSLGETLSQVEDELKLAKERNIELEKQIQLLNERIDKFNSEKSSISTAVSVTSNKEQRQETAKVKVIPTSSNTIKSPIHDSMVTQTSVNKDKPIQTNKRPREELKQANTKPNGKDKRQKISFTQQVFDEEEDDSEETVLENNAVVTDEDDDIAALILSPVTKPATQKMGSVEEEEDEELKALSAFVNNSNKWK